jgi:tetratricopeptide (TPR) repeat protein
LQALALYERSIAIERRRSPDAEISDAMLVNRAQQQKVLARYAEARDGYDAMLRRSNNRTLQAYALNGKADVLRLQGDLDQAQQLLDEAAAKLREGNVEAEHPASLRQVLVQAKIWAARGRVDEANTAYTGLIDGYSGRECCRGPQASALLSRAELAVAGEQWSSALADTERALRLAQGEQGQTAHSFVTGNAWLMLGRIQAAQGRSADSAKSYELAVSHLSSTLGDDHPDTKRAKAALVGEAVPIAAMTRMSRLQ